MDDAIKRLFPSTEGENQRNIQPDQSDTQMRAITAAVARKKVKEMSRTGIMWVVLLTLIPAMCTDLKVVIVPSREKSTFKVVLIE